MLSANTALPSERFDKIFKFSRFCAYCIGSDVYDPKFGVSWRTVVLLISIFCYLSFTALTIAKSFSDDWTILLEASCQGSTAIQGICKFSVVVINRAVLVEVYQLTLQMYRDYEGRGAVYVDALHKRCDQLKHVIFVIVVIYFFVGLFVVVVPIGMHIITGNRYMVLHFQIPGFDSSTYFGYVCLLVGHSFCVFVATFGLFAGDTFVLIFFLQVLNIADILRIKIKEVNELASDPVNRTSGKITKALHDIVKWHLHYSNFVKLTNDGYSTIVTVQLLSIGISIVLTIYVLLTSVWPSGYPYLLGLVVQLYIFCLLGSCIENCNDDFSNEIYNIHWYNMTVPDQKIVLIMLIKSQHPQQMFIADIMPLSVELGVDMTKTIYSMTMMMIQFLVE